VRVARSIRDAEERAEALELFPAAIAKAGDCARSAEAARLNPDAYLRAGELLRLARDCPKEDPQRQQLAREAVEAAATLPWGFLRVRGRSERIESRGAAFVDAADLLPLAEAKPLLLGFLSAEAEDHDHKNEGRVRVILNAVTVLVRQGCLTEARSVVETLPKDWRWAGWSRLAKETSGGEAFSYWKRAVECVSQIEDVRLPVGSDPNAARDRAWSLILPEYGAEFGLTEHETLRLIQSPRIRAETLIELSASASEPDKTLLRREARALAGDLDPSAQASVLSQLIHNSSDSEERTALIEQAMECLNEAPESEQAQFLGSVADYIDAGELQSFAEKATDPWVKESCLARSAVKLGKQGDCSEALEIIRSLELPGYKSNAEAGIAPYADDQMQEEILADIGKMTGGFRSREDDIFHGDGSRTHRTFSFVTQSYDLGRVAPHIHADVRPAFGRAYQSLVRRLSEQPRRVFLLTVRDLPPAIAALDGAGGLIGAVHAIDDVCRWWP
jgi:hypothetical protein